MARKERPEEDFAFEELEAERPYEDGTEHALLGSGAFTSGLLLLTGFGFVAFGVALQLAPRVAWPLVDVERTLSASGAPPFVIALTGFVAFGFGLVHRAARRPHVRVAPALDPTFTERQDQAQMELVGGLHRVQEAVEGLGRRLTQLGEGQARLQESIRSHDEERRESGASNEAVFRLAAGLDKLHARFDAQLGDLSQRQLQETQQLTSTVAALADQLGRLEQGLGDLNASSAAAPSTAVEPSAPPPVASAAAPSQASNSAPTPFEATMEPEPPHAPAPPPAADAPAVHDIYAARVPEEPEPAAPAVAIDSDRMVEEGLDALAQLEDGRPADPAHDAPAPSPAEPPRPARAEDVERAFARLEEPTSAPRTPARPTPQTPPLPEPSAEPGYAQPASAAPPVRPAPETVVPETVVPETVVPEAVAPEPPPALPSPQPRASEDALEALLPDEALREALDGRY